MTPGWCRRRRTTFPSRPFYGASKLAGEALIEAFSEAFGMRGWIYRFVSIVGERHPHGVTYDFVHELKRNPRVLEILGDGRQRKSYMYVGDCIEGIMCGYERGSERINIFNLGLEETVEVDRVAEIVVEEMGLKDVEFRHTGGDRGWVGDAPLVLLDVSRIKSLGWRPRLSVEEGIRRTARWLLDNPGYYGE
ncbi:MAG: GDP-mannose 4,6-dehydratase [Thermoplasmata archaeon]|nr:GDP-mannose 4,6-dehydratase [Thermoplasmata archaeon]